MAVTTLIPVTWWDEFEPPDGLRAEIIQGELILSPSASKMHALVIRRLLQILDDAAPEGHMAVTGLEWRLTDETVVASAPIPDVMVVAEAGDDVDPILAVEVLSPSDRQHLSNGMTRIEGKRADYAAHGLGHYLEVDLALRTITRYHLVDGALVVVEHERMAVDTTEPFPYRLLVSDLFG
jgi:Uma2 family endonuclease